MSTKALTVPQLGEGLREAKLLRILKHVGETVIIDTPLYEIETEKAVVQVESSITGKVLRWYAAEGDLVAVYAPIVDIEMSDRARPADSSLHATEDARPSVREPAVRIPPRARVFARALGLTDADLASIPASAGVLSERDIERWLEERKAKNDPPDSSPGGTDYTETPLSTRQQAFNQRAFDNPATPVPATIKLPISWATVTAARNTLQSRFPNQLITEFQVLVYAAAQAAIEHPKFRTRLLSRTVARCYHHIDIGFAIRLPDDDLTTAVVKCADTLAFEQIAAAVTSAMKNALRDKADQANERTTLLISYMASYGITDAQPVLIAPAVAVLFVGAPQRMVDGEKVLLVLTFDHRLINGVGAARYLQAISRCISAL